MIKKEVSYAKLNLKLTYCIKLTISLVQELGQAVVDTDDVGVVLCGMVFSGTKTPYSICQNLLNEWYRISESLLLGKPTRCLLRSIRCNEYTAKNHN